MIAQIASYGRPNLAQSQMARAVTPAAVAPTLRDRPQPQAPRPAASAVAFAPAAMTALIEAQEHLAHNAPVLVRKHAAQRIDQLMSHLDAGDTGHDVLASTPLAIRELRNARNALSQSLIDLQA